jgi:hypothetical protein
LFFTFGETKDAVDSRDMGGGNSAVSTTSPYHALPITAKLRLDRICKDFEEAWRREPCPNIDPFLREVPAAERHPFLQELILLDLEYRRRNQCRCPVEDYLQQFPELDPAWLRDAWDCEGEDGTKRTMFLGSSEPERSQAGDTAVREWLGGKYEILEEIGRGGMGVVYRAHQSGVRRVVAIKMILGGEHTTAAALERFRIEAEAAARLRHDGIVQIFDLGTESGRPYLVMEYVPGGSLKSQLDGTPWPGPQAAELVERLARIIHAAHEKQIIHRDLKPANILLSPDGQIRITDFGLAKLMDESASLTLTGEVLGTPSYMAPEQARGERKEILPATDVYALGVILYELLTGRPPFKGATATETIMQVITEPPIPPRLLNPRVAQDLETICLQCLQKEPGRRYASALALAEDLARYRDHRPILAHRPGWKDTLMWALGRQYWVARATWGRISLAHALIGFVFQIVIQWLIHSGQRPEVWWLCVATLWILVAATFARYLGPRRHELTSVEQSILAWCCGYVLGSAALWIALGAPTDERLLTTYYPAVAVITGLGYFVQGSLYWGRFYFFGVGMFVLAAAMPLWPQWAPLQMGVAFAIAQGSIGWHLLRHTEPQRPAV